MGAETALTEPQHSRYRGQRISSVPPVCALSARAG
jgi:hypothetical protein